MAAVPELIDDAIPEILLRVPPEELADLMRAALVCKLWRRVLIDPAFLRRYRAFHRAPPLLGYFLNDVSCFVPTTEKASPVLQPEFDGHTWWAISCHHGRVLLRLTDRRHHSEGLVVWDPITGDRHRLPNSLPSHGLGGGCDGLHCQGGPFFVVSITYDGIRDGAVKVFVYSSQAGAWSQRASLAVGVVTIPGAIIGHQIYFENICFGRRILKYDLEKDCISVLESPQVYHGPSTLMELEDGSLGITSVKGSSIYIWSRKENRDEEGWVQCRVINVKELIPNSLCNIPSVIGFAEGVGVMLVDTGGGGGVFTIHLKSRQTKKVCEPASYSYNRVVPFVAFYTSRLC